ncbi:unnamed protein product [Arabis nemorensis]|uniref:Uncharacterized protein n=1 Tax=Arabis nemorensis TaxID=586526 RepID=A0A565BSS2_9BRAS|nr:unnamed protein product [Arabis nemorensis]
MSILDAVPGDGSIGDDALQMFCEAMSDIPASITAPPLQTEQVGPKRSVTTVNLTRQPARTTKRKSHVCPGGSLLTASDHSIALGNLSKQVFPRDREALNELGHAAILEKSQHLLLEVMYVCSHVKTELDVLTEEVARLKEANQLLKKDKEAEISRRDSLITTKEAEGKTLKDQVYDLTSQLNLMTVNSKQLEQDLALHRKKLRVAGPAATILCRWKMVQEYMNGHAKNWEPLPVEQQFREVETACAKLNGEVPLVFPEAFTTFPEATSAPTSTE